MAENEPAEIFCDHFGIIPKARDLDLLHHIGATFSKLPYENITKLIKKYELPPGPQRRRLPAEVMQDHLAFGAGGTCFALTTLFSAVLARLGFSSFPVLCDAPNRLDQHCALVVPVDDLPHLIDPGYLLHTPIPLAPGRYGHVEIRTTGTDTERFDVFTYGVFRYRVKPVAVTPHRFGEIWDHSFDWNMMNGVHLSAQFENGYAYVHNLKMRLTRPDNKENINLRGRETEALGQTFGIADSLVTRGYQILDDMRRHREP